MSTFLGVTHLFDSECSIFGYGIETVTVYSE